MPQWQTSVKIKQNPKEFNLALQTAGHTIKRDLSASVNDMGDSILNVELHSILQPRLNPIDSSYGDG